MNNISRNLLLRINIEKLTSIFFVIGMSFSLITLFFNMSINFRILTIIVLDISFTLYSLSRRKDYTIKNKNILKVLCMEPIFVYCNLFILVVVSIGLKSITLPGLFLLNILLFFTSIEISSAVRNSIYKKVPIIKFKKD